MKNVVLFVADDLGWRDLQCYGSSFYQTPNLDRLSRESLVFDNAYATSPVCSPSRASIMSGQYPARLGLTDWIDNDGVLHPASGKLLDAPYVRRLNPKLPNLARILQQNGFQTWHLGKWHLGGGDSAPEGMGFDVNIGGCEVGSPGGAGYFSPWGIPALQNAEYDIPDGTYLSDFLTQQAIRLIRQRDRSRPFFLNMWYYLVHTPIQAPEALASKYRDKMKTLGLSDMDPFVLGEKFPCAHKKDARVQRRVLQSDPVYAAMVESLDNSIGQILAALRDEGLYDESLLLFTSDNGGLATAEGSPTSNLPLSEGKGWSYEGGVRVPFIVRTTEIAQKVSHNRAATQLSEAVAGIDILPSICDYLDIAIPEKHAEKHTLDGISLKPYLLGVIGGPKAERPLFWHYPHYGNQGGTPSAAVRLGGWKLIYFYETAHCELYHLPTDPSETQNLSLREPQKCEQLRRLLFGWQAELEAKVPAPCPDFRDWEGRGSGSRFAAS